MKQSDITENLQNYSILGFSFVLCHNLCWRSIIIIIINNSNNNNYYYYYMKHVFVLFFVITYFYNKTVFLFLDTKAITFHSIKLI